ncbi:nuclear transport factor 2 family protein [Bradyrhizobium sp. Ash2021]|uniref:nuclear transport factor 2 family protein n=1 Tax=Bradyrhizobium sp. Ash2021 TaxID=2954771 RepID=UPI0028149C63|nr:nuclear transport factor 2 family protein [Bradyrhizobium sp. Ash2021]WMT76503.1 nuclear transport factor 2 family protein [Bradyrhizobium sp. Ash2021]
MDEAAARAFFSKFVAAQNAHNADDVKSMLWNSPSMLWFSRGGETRGRDAVAARFKEYYEGTWHLEPDMSQFHVAAISDDVMQILVPIVFTRGLPANRLKTTPFSSAKRSFAMQMVGTSLPSCRLQTPSSNSRGALHRDRPGAPQRRLTFAMRRRARRSHGNPTTEFKG